jgi:UDP-N-acetylglucosamine 2-epimerase (non-hydrolysing)
MDLAAHAPCPVYFLAGYRTQRSLREMSIAVPGNVILVDPVGYDEILALIANSRGVLTDSGTVVEETCVLGVPSVQMRKSTERPQVYDARSSVKFDPADAERCPVREVFRKLESLRGGEWRHALGDGKSSERIVADLLRRVREEGFSRHRPELYHLPIERSYQGDGIE